MTITEVERRRLIGESGGVTSSYPKFRRSGVAASLIGMLAGMGMLVVLIMILGAGAILLNLEFDLISTAADVEGMSVLGIVIAGLVVFLSTFVGGFVGGRVARYGGIRIGLGSSAWLLLALALFAGLALLLGAVSDTFDGFDLADRLARFDTRELILGASITAAVLVALSLLGGLVGGRVGETRERDVRDMTAVLDLRTVDPKEGHQLGEAEADTRERQISEP